MLRKTWLAQGGGWWDGPDNGIDQALWDIKAKPSIGPSTGYLAASVRTDPLYASQIHFGWPPNRGKPAVSPEELGQAAIRAVEDGFSAVKVGPGHI